MTKTNPTPVPQTATAAAPEAPPAGPPSVVYDPKADTGEFPQGVRVKYRQTLANGAVIEHLA